MSQSINNLNAATPTTASQIPFYDPNSGQDRRMSVSDLQALLTSASSGLVTQYAAPNASGYSITVAPPVQGQSMWLLVTPLAGYAAMTILLPVGSDGQEVLVSCTQSVTTLTTTGATVGASPQPVNGAPATLAANAAFRLRFDGVNKSWYRAS